MNNGGAKQVRTLTNIVVILHQKNNQHDTLDTLSLTNGQPDHHG
jgi:hypothetical protein